MKVLRLLSLVLPVSLLGWAIAVPVQAQQPAPPQSVECEILVVGGGFAGTAAAYEGLLAGHTVCLTEITDWIGGQVSAQGTSALDEAQRMRSLRFFPRGYNEFRQQLYAKYGSYSSGDCWVSAACFLPRDGHELLWKQLQAAEAKGGGQLKWFPNTIIKNLRFSADGKQITRAIAIQHQAVPGTPPLNTEPLSAIIEDAYRLQNSPRLTKTLIHFTPLDRADDSASLPQAAAAPTPWYVIEATETGELIGLADIPHRLGLDPVSAYNPSSPVTTNDPYCTQGFTYTFAMERTGSPQPQPVPNFYAQYAPYFSYENENNASVDRVFTYRRIWSPNYRQRLRQSGVGAVILPGDISMQNWTWGNDYRPGTAQDNLIYTRNQLQQRGELAPGGWMGGLRTETLRRGEENAIAYYYWLTTGTTDSQLGEGVKQPDPNHRYLTGLDSPMGTVHGLSKYPYIRESRRIIGRPSIAFPKGFSVNEIDVSKIDYRGETYYEQNLPPAVYQQLWKLLSGLEFLSLPLDEPIDPQKITRRTRSTIFPDSVGIAQYAMDFHPCMAESPPEKPGNIERPGVRQAHGQAYPGEVPLRALIPQKIDNLLVTGKSIANSTIAASAYRVHGFEWSVGAAAGTTASFSLTKGVFPYELVDEIPHQEPLLTKLRHQLRTNNNPTEFPDTSIFNLDWEEWRVW
jgi:hypothetical protein